MTGRTERDAAGQAVAAELMRFPPLLGKHRFTPADLLTSTRCLLHVDGDTGMYLSIDDSGMLTLITSDRGLDHVVFVTNSARALVVQLAYRVLSGRSEFAPGHSPYEEAPFQFELEERRVLDEFERERVVIRWRWDGDQWAEAARDYSLLEGLKWAWMFTSSDHTIQNCLLDRDGHPLFRRLPGPRFATPDGDLSDLTIEQWAKWREEHSGARPTGEAEPEVASER